MNKKTTAGTLYIVATPIGNLDDISSRATSILSTVTLIACEDTRHSKKLLNHLDIQTPLTSYYREKERYKTEILVQKLLNGEDIALISDAGTPALSDPGSILVKQARREGIKIVPIPGPSALATALSAAGLEENGFFFGGFPPAKKGERRTYFQKLAPLPYPLVFYESPHRIAHSLSDALAVFGDRHALLFRELTKIHEECIEGLLTFLLERVQKGIKGELVVIIHGMEVTAEEKPDNLKELLTWYHNQPDMSLKDAVRHISNDLNLPRNEVYQEALSVWKPGRKK